ncbi:TPA: hypothetical protein ACH3X1_002693 [Trebouxia sp. C0004]
MPGLDTRGRDRVSQPTLHSRCHKQSKDSNSEGADPSCSASTLSNEEYASLLEAAMRYPDKQLHS